MRTESTTGPGGDVTFDETKEDDVISITTANSLYEFLITEPDLKRGVLTGGMLGSCRVNAFAVESRLRSGARATLFVELAGAVLRLTTSVVRQVACDRRARPARTPETGPGRR